jgi:hypothetical protein
MRHHYGVFVMPDNVVRPDFLTKLPLDPDQVLKAAEERLSEVLVIGWTNAATDAAFYFAASDADLSRASMLLLRALRHVTESME